MSEKGDLNGIRQLLTNPWVGVDIQDEQGLTPLARAALALQPSVVEYLLWCGADPRIAFKDQKNVYSDIVLTLMNAQGYTSEKPKINCQSQGGLKNDGRVEGSDKGIRCSRDRESYHSTLQIAKAILHDFPECKPSGSVLRSEMIGNEFEELRAMIRQMEEFEFGSYRSIDGENQTMQWMQLDFAVAFSCTIPKECTVQDVVKALHTDGVPASVVARSTAEV